MPIRPEPRPLYPQHRREPSGHVRFERAPQVGASAVDDRASPSSAAYCTGDSADACPGRDNVWAESRQLPGTTRFDAIVPFAKMVFQAPLPYRGSPQALRPWPPELNDYFQHWQNLPTKPDLKQPLVMTMIHPPRADGFSTAITTDSLNDPKAVNPIASVAFDTHAALDPGAYGFRKIDDPAVSNVGQLNSEIAFVENSEGSFKVLKRLDGPETLVVIVTKQNEASDPGTIVIQVQDAAHKNLIPEFTRSLRDVTPLGVSFSTSVTQAAAYNVNVFRRRGFTTKSATSLESSLKVEVQIVPPELAK